MGVYSRTITNRGICTTRGSHNVIIKDLYCEKFPMGVYSRTITNRGFVLRENRKFHKVFPAQCDYKGFVL